jgi:hypothetical protein
MSKRLNPHRRLLAKQAALRRDLAEYGNASDVGKLQQGRVRSALSPVIHLSGYATPRPAYWEGRGKPGKVVRGQLKVQRPGTKNRFGSK